MVAFATLDAAAEFRSEQGEDDNVIWRVETVGETHEGDSRCVSLAETPIKVIDNAGLYWVGISPPDGRAWHRECLLELPVRVAEAISPSSG